MEKNLKNLQLMIDEDVIEMLRKQKKIQRKSMSQIVEDLIFEVFATPSDKLKRL